MTLRAISLGAGVQSSRLLLGADRGEFGPHKPDVAIFADTQDETPDVYEWLEWLKRTVSIPIVTVSIGKLSLAAKTPRVSKRSGDGYMKPQLPTYLSNGGHMPRHCTMDFKIVPIVRYLQLIKGTHDVEEWLGISADEKLRVAAPAKPWITNRYPLIEADETRDDCQQWIWDTFKRVAPRSACKYCPFKDETEWYRLFTDQPEEFAEAVLFEKDLQRAAATTPLRGIPYLHDSRQPLETIDFKSLIEEREQGNRATDECKARCMT